MSIAQIFLTMALLLASVAGATAQQPALRTHNEFTFTVDAPFADTMPLFGANDERKWAHDWNPSFLYPSPARDEPGMVFTVQHGALTSTWVNTAFDLANGHVQYTYVLADAMATNIDIHATPEGANKTKVHVVYERTALTAEANDHVKHFAAQDSKAGDEWKAALNEYFEKSRKK